MFTSDCLLIRCVENTIPDVVVDINEVNLVTSTINGLFQLNSAPPMEDVSAIRSKKSGIPLAILQNFPGNPEWENKKVWIIMIIRAYKHLCEFFFLEMCVKIRVFVPKTRKSRTLLKKKKRKKKREVWKSNLLYGVGQIFLEQLNGVVDAHHL